MKLPTGPRAARGESAPSPRDEPPNRCVGCLWPYDAHLGQGAPAHPANAIRFCCSPGDRRLAYWHPSQRSRALDGRLTSQQCVRMFGASLLPRSRQAARGNCTQSEGHLEFLTSQPGSALEVERPQAAERIAAKRALAQTTRSPDFVLFPRLAAEDVMSVKTLTNE